MISLSEAVLRHVSLGDRVQITCAGTSIPGEVRDVNDHFVVLHQKDGMYLLFWKSVDSVRKSTAPKS